MNFASNNPDNTNSAELVNSSVSVMGTFVGTPKIFHCPADTSAAPVQSLRVRSVSMNQTVGTVDANSAAASGGQLSAGGPVNRQWVLGNNIGYSRQTAWRTYGKTASMSLPGPSMLWVFVDEHPDSINDAGFAVEMAKVGPFAQIIDYPASSHGGACGFSFADGHAEIHKWLGSTIQSPVVNSGSIGYGAYAGKPVGDSAPDVLWLQQHTSAPQ